MTALPKPTPKPCDECPWRRDSLRGHVGPIEAADWAAMMHGEEPVACHKTIKRTDDSGHGEWDDPAMRQCRGAGIFRTNIFKSPRDPEVWTSEEPDRVLVFGWDDEFVEHHTFGELAIDCIECGTLTRIADLGVEDEDFDPTEVPCPTCEDRGVDPYCYEPVRLIPCYAQTGVCRGENHHHGDGLHHVPFDPTVPFLIPRKAHQ